jgi:hypothetical protein
MIDGLGQALRDSGLPGLTALHGVLADLLDESRTVGRVTAEHCLKTDKVYRLEFEIDGRRRSLIARGTNSARAERNRLVVTRWLPAVGMGRYGAALLGIGSDQEAQWIWQVYQDLGDQRLDANPERGRVEATVDVFARLHVRFADHPLLAECRMYGKDMGMTYFLANVRDAIHGLEYFQPQPSIDTEKSALAVRDRLLSRLYGLLEEGPDRTRVAAELGGPETMLHGDLFPKNVLTVSAEGGLQPTLIDWDATGVGPLTYDLSTFLYRSPAEHRPWILDRYEQSVAPLGWRVPSIGDLNLMLETAELSRIANSLVWVCVAALDTQADWILERMAEIERWFEAVEPAIRPGRAAWSMDIPSGARG